MPEDFYYTTFTVFFVTHSCADLHVPPTLLLQALVPWE